MQILLYETNKSKINVIQLKYWESYNSMCLHFVDFEKSSLFGDTCKLKC